MIDDMSRTLQEILDDPSLAADFPELLAANVVFARPDANFQPQAPASINLFLYEIRENLELRNNQPILRRNNGDATLSPPPRRIDLSYLLTAWPTGGPPPLELREHQLLGQALQVLGRYPKIPPQFLQGSLIPAPPPAPQEPELPMMAPFTDGLKTPAEFWTAMGNQVRASFTVNVTISVPVLPEVTGPVVATVQGGFDAGAGVDETVFQIGGRVADLGGAAVAGAVVDVLDAGLRARSDADGLFSFRRVPAGNRAFRVIATGFQPLNRAVPVPGRTEDYFFELTPL